MRPHDGSDASPRRLREGVGIGPLDEYPIHQAALPIAWAATSDRNFYDRCYLNAHDRTGDLFLITGLGVYPNLGTKDAFVLLRRGEDQTAVHLSDGLDPRGADRLDGRVGSYRVEIVEPLRRIRVVMEETHGLALDLTFEGSFDVVQEQAHVMRRGPRITLDAQRFAQVGTCDGVLAVDGDEIALTPDRWVSTRDRSWGIRPVGEAEPSGRPEEPAFEGMWWLYVPLRFEEFAVVVIIQETPDGFRTVNDCTRVFPDGRIEQLGWPRVEIRYASGTRTPTGATIRCTTPDGKDLTLDLTSKLAVPLHIGAGYGNDPDWAHGQWKGEGFTERRTYDMTSPDVAGRVMFGVIDHVARAVAHGPDASPIEGFGLFEHAALGRHDPSGFQDWFDPAP